MKCFKSLFLLILVFLTAVSCSNGKDKEAIKASYSSYKKALLDNDGYFAYAMIDSNSKAYYDDILHKTMYLPMDETKSLPLCDKLAVTLTRHAVSPTTLKAMDGQMLFVYAVEHGWIAKDIVAKTNIAISEIDGATAKTNCVVKNRKIPVGYTFHRENDEWLIDLTSIFHVMEVLLEEEVRKTGLSEDQFISAMLQSYSGDAPDETIWHPLY